MSALAAQLGAVPERLRRYPLAELAWTFTASGTTDRLPNRQDWAICESVQRGMSSRMFQSGYYAPMESSSLDIRRYVRERLDTPMDGGAR